MPVLDMFRCRRSLATNPRFLPLNPVNSTFRRSKSSTGSTGQQGARILGAQVENLAKEATTRHALSHQLQTQPIAQPELQGNPATMPRRHHHEFPTHGLFRPTVEARLSAIPTGVRSSRPFLAFDPAGHIAAKKGFQEAIDVKRRPQACSVTWSQPCPVTEQMVDPPSSNVMAGHLSASKRLPSRTPMDLRDSCARSVAPPLGPTCDGLASC